MDVTSELIRRVAQLEKWRERQETLEGRRTWLFSQTANVTVANTTTETTLVGSGVGSLSLPANFFTVGRTIRIRAMGSFGYTATPTVLLRVYAGATNIGGTGAMTLTGAAALNVWKFDAIYTLIALSVANNMYGMVNAEWWLASSGANQISGGTAVATTFDQTLAATLDFKVVWGTANVLNTITCNSLVVEVLN